MATSLKVTKNQAIEKAKMFVDFGYVYIYGYKEIYNPVTLSRIEMLRKENPNNFTASYTEKAKKLVGKRAIDCSGLVCQCLGIADIGSYQICDLPFNSNLYKYINAPEAGCILWKKGHVGICVSEDKAIEARSMDAGVGYFNLHSQPWSKFIMPYYLPTDEVYSKTGWIYEPDGSCWYAFGKKKGEYYRGGIYEIDGKKYMFDKQGFLVRTALVTTYDDGHIRDIVMKPYRG